MSNYTNAANAINPLMHIIIEVNLAIRFRSQAKSRIIHQRKSVR